MAYAIGLNSGSSFDGVDAVLIEINQAEDGSVLPPKYIDALSIDWPEDIQQQVLAAFDDTLGIFKLTRLNYVCGAVFAQAASELMKKHNLTGKDIDVIGYDGQTVGAGHVPDDQRFEALLAGVGGHTASSASTSSASPASSTPSSKASTSMPSGS